MDLILSSKKKSPRIMKPSKVPEVGHQHRHDGSGNKKGKSKTSPSPRRQSPRRHNKRLDEKLAQLVKEELKKEVIRGVDKKKFSVGNYKIPKNKASSSQGNADNQSCTTVVQVQAKASSSSSGINLKSDRATLTAKRRLDATRNTVSDLTDSTQKKGVSVVVPVVKKVYEELSDYEDFVGNQSKAVNVNQAANLVGVDNVQQVLSIPGRGAEPKTVCEAVGDMEIDTELDGPGPLSPVFSSVDVDDNVVVAVLDTNIWINSLQLVEMLANKEFPKPLLIVIPWMVLQELDTGYDSPRRTSSDNDKRRKPINYIHKLLSSNHPRIKGQRASEAVQLKSGNDEMMADDSILNCALHNQKKHRHVILVTDDRNLSNKALVHGIVTSEGNCAVKKIEEIAGNQNSDKTIGIAVPPLVPDTSWPALTATTVKRKREEFPSPVSEANGMMDIDVEMQDLVPLQKVKAMGQQFSSARPKTIFQRLEQPLLDAFSTVIRLQMIKDYGERHWEGVLKIKPPWTLLSAIKCMLVHWIAIFSFAFGSKGQVHMENLKKSVESYQRSYGTYRETLEKQIIDSALSVFYFLDSKIASDVIVTSCKEMLMEAAKEIETKQ